MEDYNKVLDATEVAENANGVAAEKMTVYNESLAAAQNRLTASIQQFAQDSNLDQILAKAYDALSKIVDILNILLNKIPVLSPLIKAMGVALAAAFAQNVLTNLAKTNTGIGTMVSTVANAIPNLVDFANILKGEVVTALAATSGGLAGLKAVLTAVTATVTTFINPVTLAVAAIGALLVIVPKVVDAFNDFKNAKEKALEKSTEELETANQNLEDTNSQIKDIQDKITEINSKGTLTLTDQAEKDRLEEQLDALKEIRDIQEEIARAKAEEQAQDVRDVVKSKYSESINDDDTYGLLAESGKTHDLADAVYPAESANVQELAANIRYLNEQKMALTGTEEDYAERLKEINSLETENKTKLLEEKKGLLEYKQTLVDAVDTSSEEYKIINDRINEITVALDPSKFPTIYLKDKVDTSGIKNKLEKAIQDGGEAGEKTAKEYASRFAQDILKDDSLRESWAKALNIDPDVLKNNADILEQEILAQLQRIYNSAASSQVSIFELTSEQVADWTTQATNALVSQDEAMKNYISTIANITEKQEILNTAYSEMKEKGELSVATVQKLIEQEPSLTSALTVENGKIKINIDSLQDLSDSYYDTAIVAKEEQIKQTQAVIDETEKRIKAMQEEMTALGKLIQKRIDAGEDVPATDLDQYRGYQKTQYYLKQQGKQAQETAEDLEDQLDALNKLRDAGLTYTPSKKSGTSKKSDADKEFENSIKEKIKNLKGVVTTYSTDGFGAWSSQEAIDKATTKYNKFLSEIVDNPEARKIAAEQLGISIEDESTEDQIRMVTNALKEQVGTIEEARQKLQTNYLKGLKEAEEAEKKQYEEAVKQIEALNKMTKEMIETGIDLLEKAGDFIFDMLDKVSERYDKQIDNLDKIMDELDDQKDAFDDKIDAQKEYLKLQKEEIDNQNELAEKTKSIADIDARLIELQYDDSAAAQTERLKLLDERAQKEKELKEFQDETAYDAQTKALDAQKKQFDDSIEAQKKALEQQKEALEASQEKFESTVSSIKSAFDGFIKILNTDVFKNLATNLLNSIDGSTLNNALTMWNRIFGTGLDSDVQNTWAQAYGAASKYGWQPGKNLQGVTDALTQGIYTKESNIGQIEQAQTANKAGSLDLVDSLVSGLKTDTIQEQLNQVTSIFNGTKTNITNIMNGLGNSISTIFGGVGDTIIKFANGLGGSILNGIQTVSNMFSGLGGTLKDVFNLDWGGITGNIQTGMGNVSGIFSSMFNPIAKGASSIGDAIGAGVTGFFPGIFSALGTLVTTVGTAMSGVLTSIATTLASIPVVGWALAAVAFAGVATLVASIAKVSSQTKSAKVSQPTQSFHAKKHHSGADYVKKENPELDKMLGLNNDETVSILKVGEAVVPTWANTASSSASSNTYTGQTATNAVESAKRATRVASSTSENSSVVNTISMPITIQGNADESTVKLLKDQSEKIAKTVFKLINKQTNMSGYRNVRAATI